MYYCKYQLAPFWESFDSILMTINILLVVSAEQMMFLKDKQMTLKSSQLMF